MKAFFARFSCSRFIVLSGLVLLAACGGGGSGGGSASSLASWAGTKQLGVVGVDTLGQSVAVDGSGNIYVAGSTLGGLDGNTLAGKRDFFVTKYGSAGAKLFTKQLGVAMAHTYGQSIAADGSGNFYVVGYTSGGLDGNTLVGTWDFFVTKYDTTGAKLFTRQLGAAGVGTFGNSVATDGSGNVYVAGSTMGGLDGNTLTGTTDFFVTKYDSAGARLFTRQFGVAGVDTSGQSVAVDGSGNIYVAGSTLGGLDGNTLAGTNDFFVTKFNSSGVKQYTRQLGVAMAHTYGQSVAADGNGNVYVAGYTSGGLDGNTLVGYWGFFVTKYDSTGAKLFTRQLGAPGAETIGRSVVADGSGNVYVAGYTSGSLNGNTLTGTNDFFITKYDSSGAWLFTRQLGVAAVGTIGQSLAVDGSGNAYVAGYTSGGLDGNTLTGTTDFFVTKYNSSGVMQ